jgi:type IV pilus assembly protein PilQ
MNKPKYAKKTFLCTILIICAWYGPAQSQPTLDAQSIAQEVGRENPFAKIPRAVQPITPIALQSSQPIEEIPELFVQTIMLKFLDAKSLKQAIDNMSSRYGTMAINEKNNSMIVCDTKEQLEKILSEIKKADKTPQQIMVEVVIVDVQLSDDTEMGVNWDILSDEIYDIGYRQNFTTRLGSTIESSANIGNATAFNTTGLGGDFSVISGNIRNVVSLLQEKKDVEILASPRVMVLSGKTASIEAVRELPYNEITDTSAGGSMSSTEFKKVGVTLDVTATLTDDNLIFLNVSSVQNVVVGQSVTEVPIIDTRNARSEVLLQDGQVVIIGGLRRKELTKEVSQIPILGDIPLIGALFKYTNTVVTNTELIMFLSPHIYTDEEPIPEDAMEKFREIMDRPMPSLEKTGDDKK